MADKKYLDEDGLAVVATKVNEKLKVVTTMPATPTNGQVVLYVGTTTATYTQGGIYLYNGTAWALISTADVDLTPYKKIFTGTKAEWEALSTAEKKAYDEADLTDDLAGGELVVTDVVTAGDLNPITSNAVAKAVGPLSDYADFVSGNTIDISSLRTAHGTGIYAIRCVTGTSIFTGYLSVWAGNWNYEQVTGTSALQTANNVASYTIASANSINDIIKLG